MGQDVFISYKSEEFQEADWVRQQLESGGISCWMAPNSITGGARRSRSLLIFSVPNKSDCSMKDLRSPVLDGNSIAEED